MPVDELQDYRWRGARALVLLHDRALRELITVWKAARAKEIRLPQTSNPAYVSLVSLMQHVLGSAREYMTWLCGKLGLPDPGIDPAPEAVALEQSLDRYVEHLLERWRVPLADVEDSRFFVSHKTEDGELTCLVMLEHAAMHPMRHQFQLEELMEPGAR